MSKIDWSALDAGLLKLLVAVLDSGSITAAALKARGYAIRGQSFAQ
jgi:hypothetical protein